MSLSASPVYIDESRLRAGSLPRISSGSSTGRTIHAILLFGSTTSLVVLVAGVALMQLTLALAGAFYLGLTLMSAYLAHKYSVQMERPTSPAFGSPREPEVERIKEELTNQRGEIRNLQETISKLREDILKPAASVSSPPPLLAASEAPKYKYRDETPSGADTPGDPASTVVSPSTSAVGMDPRSLQPSALKEESPKPLDQSGVETVSPPQTAPALNTDSIPVATLSSGWLGGLFKGNKSPEKKP